MFATRQALEKLQCVIGIARLAEHLTVQHDDGIRAQHQPGRGCADPLRDGESLAVGEALRKRDWGFAGLLELWNVRWADLEANAGPAKQIAPAR
jgi:hypothetical protein